jgi:hypothetical protein
MHYLELLRRLHDELQPAGYLEIGVDCGDSLGLSRARSVAIDPAPKPRPESLLGKPGLVVYVGTSDDFFREHERETMLRDAPLDLAFIDGLHEFAQVVRDLEHVERWGHPGTVVAIHDVLPRNAWEAARAFHDGFWTGDVWRIVPFLREHRPDLRLWLTQAEPTGMLIVTGLDPTHPGMAHLAEVADAASPPAGPDYDRLVEAFIAETVAEPAEEVIRALGLERRLGRDWDFETKWGMRLVAESSWKPLLDAAAALPGTGQHRDGLRACLRLIDGHWLPAGVREQAYGYLAAYAEPITARWAGASWQRLVPGGDSTLMRSPSPATAPDGVAVTVETAEAHEGSTWSLLGLDHDLLPQGIVPLHDETLAPAVATTSSRIVQMQPIFQGGRLCALVTLCGLNPRGVVQAGLVAIQNGTLRGVRLLSDPTHGRHERQWAPFLVDDALHAVAWWEPTEILRIDTETGQTHRVALRPAPRLAERFVGASAGVNVPGGWLFLVNEPAGVSGAGQETFARFVFMRTDFVVTAASPQFWVKERGGDTASGLTRLGDDLIAGFTAGGREAILARIPWQSVLDSLLPLAAPRASAAAPGAS